MVRGVTYVVYVIPVVFSLIFGSIVMADILQEPGREQYTHLEKKIL